MKFLYSPFKIQIKHIPERLLVDFKNIFIILDLLLNYTKLIGTLVSKDLTIWFILNYILRFIATKLPKLTKLECQLTLNLALFLSSILKYAIVIVKDLIKRNLLTNNTTVKYCRIININSNKYFQI